MEANKRRRLDAEAPAIRELGLMREAREHDRARFVGSSSGIHFIHAVYQRLSNRSGKKSSDSSRHADLVPGEDDQIQQLTQTAPGHEKISFDQLVEWSKSYFESWHPAMPFLHAEDVLKSFQQLTKPQGIDSLDNLDLCILKSIFSISLADSRQGMPFLQPVPGCILFSTIDEAMSNAQFALNEPASMKALQAALAIQTFLISMLCFNSASRLGGLIVRMSYHLGLHRCPARFPFFTVEEVSMRRRVFWCIYCSERLLSQSLGLPLDIQDEDFDVCYPGEESHDASRQAPDDMPKLQLLQYLAKHAHIRGLIVELRNKCLNSRQDTTDRANLVQSKLARWSNDIQDEIEDMDRPAEERASMISERHCVLLLLLKSESEICLNRPMVANITDAHAYGSALQACISAAKGICSAVRKHTRKYQPQNDTSNDSQLMRLVVPLVWPSLTWMLWVSAFMFLYATFDDQLSLNNALRYVQICQDTLRHLASRGSPWPKHCLSAIDDLLVAREDLDKINSDTIVPISHEGATTPSISSSARQDVYSVSANDAEVSPSHDGSSTPMNTAVYGSSPRQTRASRLRFPHIQPQVSVTTPIQPEVVLENTVTASSGHSAGEWANSAAPPALIDNSVPLHSTTVAPFEDQNSIIWYNQLFESTLSAFDSPNLAMAELDSSVNPIWSYLI